MNASKAWEPYPAGNYQVEIKECKKFTTSTGKDMLNLTCEITDPEKYAGKKVFLSLFYNDYKSVDLIELIAKKPIAEILGKRDEIPDQEVFDLLTGEFATFKLGSSEYNGKKRNEIVEVITPKEKARANLDI